MSQVEQLRAMIDTAVELVFFTGAGISTESGIPDFRSPGGLWTKAAPIQFQDFVSSAEMRREAWRRKRLLDREVGEVQPNRGHRAVASLVAAGKCQHVITQNIDGLHQQSGIADTNIIELHGNGTYAHCLDCGRRFELPAIFAAFDRDEVPPVCDQCAGLVKTATISFGQEMPGREMQRAEEAVRNCDLLIATGSSLVVYPAAALPVMARQYGADLVILNRDPTELDSHADLVVHAEIGATLGEVCGVD